MIKLVVLLVNHVPVVLSVLLVPPVVPQVVLLVRLQADLPRVILVAVENTTIRLVKPVVKMTVVLVRTLLLIKVNVLFVLKDNGKI